MKRLFIGTKEGLVLVMDVRMNAKGTNESAFKLVHTIEFDHKMKVKRMELDTSNNLLFCLLKCR